MSAAKPTQTTPATAFSVCVYRAAIEKLNECRRKCPGIGGDVDVSNLWFLIKDDQRSASVEAQAANTLESLARGLEINATREVEALRMLDAATRLIAAAPETAAERDRMRAAIAKAQAIHTDTIPGADTLDGLRLTPKGRRQLVIAAGMVNADLLDALEGMLALYEVMSARSPFIDARPDIARAALAKAKGGAS